MLELKKIRKSYMKSSVKKMDKQLSSVSEMSYATFLILCTRLITDKEFIT